MITNSFYYPSPTKSMGQVACCNSIEAKHPPFQARMVDVHTELRLLPQGPSCPFAQQRFSNRVSVPMSVLGPTSNIDRMGNFSWEAPPL
jgi:hypothetical protein